MFRVCNLVNLGWPLLAFFHNPSLSFKQLLKQVLMQLAAVGVAEVKAACFLVIV